MSLVCQRQRLLETKTDSSNGWRYETVQMGWEAQLIITYMREAKTMKISFKELRKAPFEVKASFKNLRKTYGVQLQLAKLQDSLNGEPVESMQAILKSFDDTVEYISDMLHLKGKELDALEELEQEEVTAIAQRISMRVMGMSEDEIKEALEPSDDDEEGLE